jgi:hypothetical protein
MTIDLAVAVTLFRCFALAASELPLAVGEASMAHRAPAP